MKNRVVLGAASRFGLGLLALSIGACGAASPQYRASSVRGSGGYTMSRAPGADTGAAVGGAGDSVRSAPAGAVARAPMPVVAPGGGRPRESDARDAPRQPPPPPVGAPAPAAAVTAEVTVREPPAPREHEDEQAQQTAGVLTAASVGDADRIDNYREYLSRHVQEREELGLDMSRRLRVRVVDGAGRPVNDASVRVRFGGRSVDGRTHADGSWDFFPGAFGIAATGAAAVEVTAGAAHANAGADFAARGDAQDLEFRLQGARSIAPQALDLAFAIDVTGSMGDELRYVNHEVTSIVERIRAANPGLRVRVGATFYRDRTDAELVRDLPFTSSVGEFVNAMRDVYANGGGDYPEDMNAGLDHALHALRWSEGNVARVLVVIADAPPQHYNDQQFTYRDAVREASARGIRILPVAASGANRTVEYLFRAIGAATSTPYTYLTDDSGVGGSHMEADTDRVAIERFNDLLTRMVISELRGEGMHEPGALGSRG